MTKHNLLSVVELVALGNVDDISKEVELARSNGATYPMSDIMAACAQVGAQAAKQEMGFSAVSFETEYYQNKPRKGKPGREQIMVGLSFNLKRDDGGLFGVQRVPYEWLARLVKQGTDENQAAQVFIDNHDEAELIAELRDQGSKTLNQKRIEAEERRNKRQIQDAKDLLQRTEIRNATSATALESVVRD